MYADFEINITELLLYIFFHLKYNQIQPHPVKLFYHTFVGNMCHKCLGKIPILYDKYTFRVFLHVNKHGACHVEQ